MCSKKIRNDDCVLRDEITCNAKHEEEPCICLNAKYQATHIHNRATAENVYVCMPVCLLLLFFQVLVNLNNVYTSSFCTIT